MKVLSKSDLLAATVVPTSTCAVPELGGVVHVRGMTGVERDAYESTLFKGKGRHREINLANARAKLVAFCCVDDAGRRLFTDADADELGRVRVDVLNRLFIVAQRLSGLTDEEVEDLGKPMEIQTPGGSGSSASPPN